MPALITAPTSIPVPGGKTIEEFIGLASTGDGRLSIAHMVAPAGWEEPAQTPEFDEFTLVLEGEMHVETDAGTLVVGAGQAIHAAPGERVRYLTPTGCRYVAVCLPAFSPGTVHREG